MAGSSDKTSQKALTLGSHEAVVQILGPRDAFLRQVRDAFDVRVVARGRQISVEGPEREVEACAEVLEALRRCVAEDKPLDARAVTELIQNARARSVGEGEGVPTPDSLDRFLAGGITRPKTRGQADYVKAILEHDVVFCIGPAGSGKTYLAVAVALDYLRRGLLKRMVLCRPAVEAGEHLGFLPGDLRAKVNPYLRPLYDALHDLMDPGQVRRYLDNDLIEILPLAFVRGRTLDQAFIILDEAQNCTVDQMKTFLTRLGVTAKLVVTGDITQVDLPADKQSGLVDVQGRLDGVRGIAFVRLGMKDIVRHRLVRDIVNAYQKEPPAESERHEGHIPREGEDA